MIGHVFVCKGYRVFLLLKILIFDFGIFPTVWFFYFSFYLLYDFTQTYSSSELLFSYKSELISWVSNSWSSLGF